MNNDIEIQLQAATFRKFIAHLQAHPEVQNIELMILADFCRNCLAKWYSEAAHEHNQDIDYEQARTLIYGMPYSEWKKTYQKEATSEQLAIFEQRQALKQMV